MSVSCIDRILNEEHYEPRPPRLPRWVRVDEVPPLETHGVHSVSPGDLVVWNVRNDTNPRYYSPRLGERACGIVLETRWSIVDWSASGTHHYAPEAAIMWNDGQFTNSHQSTIRKVTARMRTKR
jgi:hypothetical protein